MANALTIANYFIQRASELGEQLTPMQIIKLVYIAHGWSLGLTDKPLIDETVQAWKYGPVVKSVYDEFKSYGKRPIQDYARDIYGNIIQEPLTDNDIAVLDFTLQRYGKNDGIKLSGMTHKKDTPWDKVWNDENGKSLMYAPIDNEKIKEYYQCRRQQIMSTAN